MIPAVVTAVLGASASTVGIFAVCVITYRVYNGLLDYINYAEIFAGYFSTSGPGLRG